MEAKHAPEPWTVARVGYGGFRDIMDGGGAAVARCFDERAQHPRPTPETASASARRIVACVNACDGINPEAVPDLLDFVRRVVADAGATVCKGANGEPELCGGLDPAILLDEFFRHGKKAIARAEGR